MDQQNKNEPTIPSYVQRRGGKLHYWPSRPGTYEQGVRWADETLGYIDATGFAPLLTWTLLSMPRLGEHGPAEQGFIDRLANRAGAS